jgi:hypothetical protein
LTGVLERIPAFEVFLMKEILSITVSPYRISKHSTKMHTLRFMFQEVHSGLPEVWCSNLIPAKYHHVWIMVRAKNRFRENN